MLLRIELDLVAAFLGQHVDHVHRVELRALEDEPAVLGVNLTRGIEPAKTGVQGSSVPLIKAWKQNRNRKGLNFRRTGWV